MSNHQYGVILVLDIDYFKEVNDNNGHPYGDEVLIKLANTMQESFKSGICGRIGGDEFIIYLALDDGKNYQELWSNADKALYLSKNNGRNRISIYQL